MNTDPICGDGGELATYDMAAEDASYRIVPCGKLKTSLVSEKIEETMLNGAVTAFWIEVESGESFKSALAGVTRTDWWSAGRRKALVARLGIKLASLGYR